MSPRVLYVTFVNRSCAYLRGHGARELLTDLRGRPPVYGARVRAWHCQPSTAHDAIAMAESRRWAVEIVSEADLLRMAGHEADEDRQARAHARGELFG